MIDQRLRSRILTAVELLAEGREGARNFSSEWFEQLFGFMWESENADRLSTLSESEREQLKALRHLVSVACSATLPIHSGEELIATGWPDRIGRVARGVLETMVKRGFVSDEVDENEPSIRWAPS